MRQLLLLLQICVVQFVYSADSFQWIQRADFGNFGRHRATGMSIGNKAYVGMGHLNGTGFDTWYADWWEYDPATNAWIQKADYPGNNGNGDQDIVSLSMDTVGYAGLGQFDGLSFFKYSPVTNTWTQVASAPANGDFNNTFPFRIGNFGYFPGLYSTNFFRYDPANDTWLQLNPLPFTTQYGIPTFAIGDKGYIKNGNAFYEYDPSLDAWTPKASFPGLYPHRPRGISQFGYGFFIDGFTGNPATLPWEWDKQVWRYDPGTDSWDRLEDHPGTIRRWAVIANVNDRVFYGLGTNGTNFNDWWEFNAFGGLDENQDFGFNTFPNPAIDFVTFTSEKCNQFEVVVYDVQGRSVGQTTATNGEARLDREAIPAGVYLYKICIDNNLVYSNKIVFE